MRGLILAHSFLVGLKTFEDQFVAWHDLINALQTAVLAICVLEIILRVALDRLRFFYDFWNIFEASVVIVAVLSNTPAVIVLRLLKELQALSAWGPLPGFLRRTLRGARHVGIALLLTALVFYVFAILSREFMSETMPDRFGNVADAFQTLMRMAVLEIRTMDLLQDIAQQEPLVWLLMLSLWGCMAFILLNFLLSLFPLPVAERVEIEVTEVQVSPTQLMQMETELVEEEFAVEAEAERLLIRAETARILDEVRGLREEMISYRERYRRRI
ncbi:ion transporter [Roseibium algae]|uniref:Ion transporter n=1 Tax=Roseibium algae TaxID=3123038 RepID=A0ABU8TGU7_9HYPH